MPRNLEELRRARGADATLRNVVSVLEAKLVSHSRYEVYEYEATSQGLEECSTVFRELGEAEWEHITLLLDLLCTSLAPDARRRSGRAGANHRPEAEDR